jgi:hypothetical protein
LLDARTGRFPSTAAILPPNHSFERTDQCRTVVAQLRQVACSELLQLGFSARGELHNHLPAVRWRARARNQPPLNQPVHQFNRTVMLDLQPFRQDANAWVVVASNRQQQLMLVRLKTGCARCLLAEMEKPPDLVPGFRQSPVI